MIWMISMILALKQFSASSQRPSLNEHHLEKPLKKCSLNMPSGGSPLSADISNHPLLVFISFSAPIETWKEHSYNLQRLKGVFVLRGVPNNSFKDLGSKILELRKAGVQAEIVLDPEAFEKYEIQSVPSIVLQKEGQYDKVSGNIPISTALSLFSEKGDMKEAALKLLEEVSNHP